ncbi:hypothetical protein GGS21DRAFT_423527 [Xylaria nigripes]|nr:hypothetical protein GGS21DRAFT_423527 [Xylaria nigripes]
MTTYVPVPVIRTDRTDRTWVRLFLVCLSCIGSPVTEAWVMSYSAPPFLHYECKQPQMVMKKVLILANGHVKFMTLTPSIRASSDWYTIISYR